MKTYAPAMDLALCELLELGGVTIPPGGNVNITGRDPVFPTPFLLGTAAATVLAAQGAAISSIWHQRSGRAQNVSVDIADAAVSLKSVVHLRQRGYPVPYPDEAYPLTNFYRCRDGRYIFMHAGYPHLRDGLLKLLNCPNEAVSIAKAVSTWDSAALEDAIAKAQLCGGIARSEEEWLNTPQGRLLASQPVIEIERIGDSAPEPMGAATRPLEGIRVLDLTHVLAGPMCTRTLAEQGATVLRVRQPSHPVIPSFVMDTGHGKLSTLLDLTQTPDAERLNGLLKSADIFVQSYRPGKMAGLGFSAEAAARQRPGIVYVSLSCYGESGPWGERGGWEQLAQSVTGMAVAQGGADNPTVSPVYPNDYITGYLGAYGALAALLRRAKEGGSYHVRVSLCRSAMWTQSFGRLLPHEWQPVPGPSAELSGRLETTRETPYGMLRFMGPITSYSETKPYWEYPSAPMAANSPVWPDNSPTIYNPPGPIRL